MALTIYQRYGGFPAVRKVVSDFYERALDSELLAHHFENVDMARLIDHQTRFISFLTGGPVAAYTDEHLERVHKRLNISLESFCEMVEVLTETLEDHGFEREDVARIEQELRRREGVIVSAGTLPAGTTASDD